MQDLITFFGNHPLLSMAAAVVLVLVFIVELLRAKRNTFNISPTSAVQLINHQNAVVIDIRPNDIYRKGHIIDAQSISQQEMKNSLKKLEKFKNKPIIIVCSAGIESQKVAALLLKQGYNAFSLTGGIRAWNNAGMPLVKE